MNNFVRDLIEYQGVDAYGLDECGVKHTSSSFKQTTIDVNISVPCQKPDIEQIVKVKVDKKVVKYKTVKTPIGVSEEGQEITGNKLLVMGDINLKIQYVADEPEQSMHSFHVTIPFCEYVVLPSRFKGLCVLEPSLFIEDAYVKQLSSRDIFGNVTILTVSDYTK